MSSLWCPVADREAYQGDAFMIALINRWQLIALRLYIIFIVYVICKYFIIICNNGIT